MDVNPSNYMAGDISYRTDNGAASMNFALPYGLILIIECSVALIIYIRRILAHNKAKKDNE